MTVVNKIQHALFELNFIESKDDYLSKLFSCAIVDCIMSQRIC